MFTGLVREIGTVVRIQAGRGSARAEFACPSIASEIERGDSIAVDGACLTVEALPRNGFEAFLSGETLERTTLSTLRPGQRVNVEPALRPRDRLGGHMVQGHVDGIGSVVSLRERGEGWALVASVPEELRKYIVPKGSIALSGISLTVARNEGTRIEAAIVPTTLRETTMGDWAPGRKLNVETDVIGRYIVSYLEGLGEGGGLTLEDLRKRGF